MTRIAAHQTLLTGAALAVAGVLIVGCSAQNSNSSASGPASAPATSATASPAAGATTPAASAATTPSRSTGQPTSSAPAQATSFTRVPWPRDGFFSPSGNLSCWVSEISGAGQGDLVCQAASSNQLVSMDATGSYTTCSLLQAQCPGANPENLPTLAYGTEAGDGPFLCESAATGITCTVTNGKGFQISRSGVIPVPASSGQTGFAAAQAAWKQGSQVDLAQLNEYLSQAASDLRQAGDPSYDTAISQLTYLAGLPDSNDTPTQIANAQTDDKALDTFFGTPGLYQ